ncbi:MAG: GNAT family N-acetyltransferase [Deltaproteobacteria bacterium]|nr:GNAT family N-acetyltransferase [Deltaproteobacteria bacterium]
MLAAGEVRLLTEPDLAAVFAIEQTVHSTNWNINAYKFELSRPQSVCSGVFVDEELAAFVIAYCLAPELHIQDIVTKGGFQRRGYASKLLNFVISLSRDRGAHSAFLEVREGNQPAINFYTRHKFSKYSRRLDYYGKGQNAWLMKMTFPN